jgi:hypothetical protein
MRVSLDVNVIVLLAAAASATVACSTLLGLSDYAVTPDSGSVGAEDASAAARASTPSEHEAATGMHDAAVGAPSDGNCDVDPRTQCYPCAPAMQVQFLNACTSGTCVAFDDTKRLANLLPDGALPALPMGDP